MAMEYHMIELRLCSIDGAGWLDLLPTSEVTVDIPKLHLGPMFERALKLNIETAKTASQLKSRPASGLVLAIEGPRFQQDIAVSAVHTAACAAIIADVGDAENADTLAGFLDGKESPAPVPRVLQGAGVISCMRGADAQKLAAWLDVIDRQSLQAEISDMHGEEAVEAYVSVLNSLARTLDAGTSIHGCDICCLPLHT